MSSGTTRVYYHRMNVDELIDASRMNNEVTLEYLAFCEDVDLELKPGKGKTIRSNFVHLIGVRRMWCEEKMKKEADAIPKLDWKTATREEIRQGLDASHKAMAEMFRLRDSKSAKFSTIGFFAYCIAHEANHRAQIEIALRVNGREPDDKLLYATWEWSRK